MKIEVEMIIRLKNLGKVGMNNQKELVEQSADNVEFSIEKERK